MYLQRRQDVDADVDHVDVSVQLIETGDCGVVVEVGQINVDLKKIIYSGFREITVK